MGTKVTKLVFRDLRNLRVLRGSPSPRLKTELLQVMIQMLSLDTARLTT